METGFVYLDEAVPGIRWDAKYATADNFTGAPVDGYAVDRVVGSEPMARALRAAQALAEAAGFGLLVWDGYRPQRAVDAFVTWSQAPEDPAIKAEFHPNIGRAEMITKGYVATRSGHTRGSAVDLTLFHLATGELADMGGRHDLMDERSHHGAPTIAGAAARNRSALCEFMERSGFERFALEWWHYALRDEPYPDTFFDFPVA